MATEFKLPELGENIEEAQVVGVMVSQGDTVDADQAVIEVETDKAVMEVPISAAGKIAQVFVGEGDTIHVGDTILSYEADGQDKGKAPPDKTEPEAGQEPEDQGDEDEPEAKEKAADQDAQQQPAPEDDGGESADEGEPEASKPRTQDSSEPAPANVADDRVPVFASPTVRRLAREIGVDITQVTGSGPGGRIGEDDVKKHARRGGGRAAGDGAGQAIQAPPLPDFAAHGPVERQAMSMIARKTAQHMARCWTVPHVTLHETVDVTDLEKFRQANKAVTERQGGKLTVTAILVKLVTAALKQFPVLNCSFDPSSQELIFKKYYHIGVAADTPRGLVVPVIRDADRKSLLQISRELGELAQQARDGKLALEQMQGGTFTLTNLGGIGVGHFSPIVNHPEVAILGAGTANQTLVPVDGEHRTRLMMPISLSFDHRVVNGADGARFVSWIKNTIEQPLGALLS
jgi:pyruvate dehydrogenase E2 component (dihydrolipoamide acetyltransferase)